MFEERLVAGNLRLAFVSYTKDVKFHHKFTDKQDYNTLHKNLEVTTYIL